MLNNMKMLSPKKVIIFSILGFLLGSFLTNIYELGFCTTGFCRDFVEDVIGIFISFFSIAIFPISIIFIFLRKEIFSSWLKFAKIYIPVSMLLTILSGEGTGGGGIGLDFDYEITVWFTAGLFFVVSLIFITYKSFKLRGK